MSVSSRAVRAKRALRPVVFRGRRWLRTAGLRLRPPIEWDGTHDPALLAFAPWSGESDGRSGHDFLGVRTAPHFREQLRADPPGPVRPDYPPPHAAYFEWAFVLDSVLRCDRGRFVTLELGAGYGPWLVAAHRAARRRGIEDVDLVGVEMVDQHFGFLQEHFRNNGIEPDDHELIRAAVSSRGGVAAFRPETDPRLDYGQHLIGRPTTTAVGPDADAGSERRGRLEPVRVRCLAAGELVRARERYDLVHIDIQGEELGVIRAAAAEIDARVARLIVATHSRRIHRALRRHLADAGWTLRYDFGCRARERTPYGDVQFLDGLLAAINPRLEPDPAVDVARVAPPPAG